MKSIKQLIQQNQPKQPERRNYYLIPVITGPEYKATFDNYELYVLKYNTAIANKNRNIKDYNAGIVPFEKLTPEHQAAFLQFEKEHKHLSTTQYNAQAVKWNKVYGKKIIPLRRHKKIKYQTQRIFAEIVKHQARQLNNRTRQNIKLGISTRLEKSQKIDLPIWRSKIAKKLGISQKTVYNQIQHMLQVGILTGYRFRGSDKAFIIQINPKILEISDAANRTRQNVENQFFKTTSEKDLPHNVLVNQEHLNKSKDNDTENSASQKELSNHYQQADKTSSTNKNFGSKPNSYQTDKQELISAAAGSKYEKLSNLLKMSILHYYILAKSLFEGKFKNYTPIKNHSLKLEVLYGKLTRSEFRELMIQEMLKTSAKLWRDWKYGTVYQGEWLKTLRLFEKHYFLTSNGNIPHKDTMFEMLLNYKWRLKTAMNYKALNPDWNPPRPSEYFNPYLKTTGFAKTKEFWRNKQQQSQTNDKDLRRKAFKTEAKNALWRKLDYRISRVMSGKMTPAQFANWIEHNATAGITADEIIKYVNNKTAKLTEFNLN